MEDFGHEHVDLLKLDIEGAEHAVLSDVLAKRLQIMQICVEFDQPVSVARVTQTIRRLQRHGYRLICRRGWDYTFLRNSE